MLSEKVTIPCVGTDSSVLCQKELKFDVVASSFVGALTKLPGCLGFCLVVLALTCLG